MSAMNGDDFVVSFAPQAAAAKLAQKRGELRQRIISLVISIAIGVAIWYFYREQLGNFGPWVIALSSAAGLVWLVISLIGWLIARRELRRVGEGPAVAVTRDGIWALGQWTPWPTVGSLSAAAGRWGRTPDLVIAPRDANPVKVPMDYLDTLPATLDSAVRALSGGRSWIDLSRLDD